MSNGPSPHDVRALLANAQFPTMQLDSAGVLDRARRRVHRRRAQVIGVALAALLVLAPSGWLALRAVNRSGPVPAGRISTTEPLTTGLFAKNGAVGNLGDGRVSLYPTTNCCTSNSGHPTTFQVSSDASGLRVVRVGKGTTVDLHRTSGGPSGLFQSANGTHGIVAVKIPSDTTEVQLVTGDDESYGFESAVASTLPDGTSVALIETSSRLKHPVAAVIWQRANGAIGASTGETPVIVRQDHDTFYYFGRLGAFGLDGPHGSDMIRARGLTVGESPDGSKSMADFVIAGLYPHGVRNVRLSPAIPGTSTAITPVPGTKWDLVTARYRASTKRSTPKVVSNYGTWDPSAGNPPRTAPAR